MISRTWISSVLLSFVVSAFLHTGVFAAEKGRWNDSNSVYLATYLVGSHNGKPGCEIQLTDKPLHRGNTVENAINCLKIIPRISDVVEWKLVDVSWLELRNAEGKVKARFFSEDGSEWAEEKGDLETALLMVVREFYPGLDHFVGFESTKGKWRIRSKGSDVSCIVTLTGKRNKKNNLRADFEPGCPPEITGLPFWIVAEPDNILLFSDEITNEVLTKFIRFQQTETGFEQLTEKPEDKKWILERP